MELNEIRPAMRLYDTELGAWVRVSSVSDTSVAAAPVGGGQPKMYRKHEVARLSKVQKA